MKLKKILIASAFLNIIFLSLTIFLTSNLYQYKNNEDNKLESSNTQETLSTEIIEKSTAPTTSIQSEPSKKSIDTTQITVPYHYSDLMENPIDKEYLTLITDGQYCEAGHRDFQERYYYIWKEEYDKTLNILKSKAVYQKDKDNIEQFDNYIESIFDNNNEFFETLVLEDYQTDPTSPQKNSYGNGTCSKLFEIRGKIYRDACMQIITLLDEGDYNFPKSIDFFRIVALSH